jgi:hypothetical protein
MTTATATAVTPPTEAEIRQALTESIDNGYVDMDDAGLMLRVVLDSDAARVRMPWNPDFQPDDDHPGTLWADLRPEEYKELSEAMYAVLHQVEREATAMLIERAIGAAVAFAAAHPDIPRGHWPLNRMADPEALRPG